MKTPSLLLPLLALLPATATLLPDAKGGELWILGPPAVLVLGQPDFETLAPDILADRFSEARQVAVDPASGKVFVVDRGAHRVLRFASFASLSNGAAAEIVLGQDDFESFAEGTAANRFRLPVGVAVGPDGTLWVADSDNHRVLRFDNAATLATGASANGVLGQPDLVTGLADTTQSGMEYPEGLSVDATGRLWVADTVNNRVLRFDNAAAKANGANADGVLGQISFATSGPALAATGLSYPRDVAAGLGGEIYVADTQSDRILRFDNAAAKANGAAADAVLGALNFGAPGTGTSSSRFSSPSAVAVDPEGRLWVGEFGNRRVMGFDGAATFANGAEADRLLGQADFTTNTLINPPTRMSTGAVDGLAIDAAGRVYVAGNARLVVFSKDRHQPDLTIGRKRGAQKGRGRYNGSGVGQTQTVRTRGGAEARYFSALWNDGTLAESFFLRSSRPNASLRLRVFQTSGGRANVSGPARSGALVSPGLVASAKADYELRLRPKGRGLARARRHRAWLQASSSVDGELDRVGVVLRHRP